MLYLIKESKIKNNNLLNEHLEYKKKIAQRLKMKLLWSMNYYSKDFQKELENNGEFKGASFGEFCNQWMVHASKHFPQQDHQLLYPEISDDNIIEELLKMFDTAVGALKKHIAKAKHEQSAKEEDSEFINQSLSNINLPYDEALSKVPPGLMGVIENQSGNFISIDPSIYDPNLYTKI